MPPVGVNGGAALLEAALELLGTRAGRPPPCARSARRAKLTPRYFYESFADRERCCWRCSTSSRPRAAAVVLAALPDAPDDARAKARAAIGAFVDFVADDPRRARVLFVEAMGSEPLARRRFETVRMFSGLVAEQARSFYRLPDVSDP